MAILLLLVHKHEAVLFYGGPIGIVQIGTGLKHNGGTACYLSALVVGKVVAAGQVVYNGC